MIRVFLLDDHALVRTGYRLILADQVDIEVVGEAATGEDALPAIRKLKPDVVVCDLHLPGISGMDVTERLVKGQVGPRVVIVSVQMDGPLPQRLLDAGANAYLGKACDAAELVRAKTGRIAGAFQPARGWCRISSRSATGNRTRPSGSRTAPPTSGWCRRP